MTEIGSIKIERTYEVLGNIFTRKTDQNVIRALEGTGFEHYARMNDLLSKSSESRKRITHSLPLLSLLVEKYNPGNKDFVLNDVTLAPTVDDVHHITGLPINGRKISEVMKKTYQNFGLKKLCEELLGKVPNNFGKKDILQFTWLKENFMIVPHDVERDSPIFEQYIRTYVLYVIGLTLFPTSSPSSVHTSFLECLRVIGEIKDLNWSSGVLDFIHTSLEKCKNKGKTIEGSTYTLLLSTDITIELLILHQLLLR
ncbi:protein MAINTENANCE OF MERISTEMS-like [Rosa chinensis]|uniref:protein MAINTENANCE OF MERISTEMS-like n=1 Tax=Rosa chinensis TaxID=74649 RepID=UPI000D08B9FE|nr:protein MAINTENANCE OF MERISTEMS-like [Rosa chinensis]